jgi:DNA-directed RNA polymerase subunit H (RpoH/RPB5)
MISTDYQIKNNNVTELNSNAIIKNVITNVIKMLIYRKWLNGNSDFIQKLTEDLLNSKKEEKIYNIKLQNNLINIETYEQFEKKTESKNFNGDNVIIFILNQKIMTKSQIITDFISKYNSYHKIIIVESITEKIKQSLLTNKYTEVFIEKEFLINIMDHVCSPQEVTVLTTVELTDLLLSYNAKKKELPKQYDIDPLSRYLYIKRGQIIRIIRNSEITGQSVAYRIIIHSKNTVK